MNILYDLLNNQFFISGVMGWFIAQFLKFLINIWLTHSINPERLIGTGGMPSSHSSTVCALATTAFIIWGPTSFEFAMSVFFAIIVMHDAQGVRMETGKQAAIINEMMNILSNIDNSVIFEKSLKVLVGHTRVQVVAGAILGVVTGLVMNAFYIGC